MTEHPNGKAPTVSPGSYHRNTFTIGSKGGRLADAWQYAWDQLSTTEWTRGDLIAADAAAKFGLKPTTVAELLSRMRRLHAGLEQKMIPVETTYVRYDKSYTANRPRVHYRIKQEEPDTTALAFSEVAS